MKLDLDIKLTPQQVAQAFCDLGDEEQAQVFIEAAKIAATWEHPTFRQWHSVGRHPRDCRCSTDGARDLVTEIAEGMRSTQTRSTHG